jgi:hypothetical protein
VNSPAVPARFAAVPGRALAALAACAAALVAAFVVGPPALVGGVVVDERGLGDAFRAAFVGYWRSGDRGLPPDLGRIVADWFQYHLVKAGVAAILLVVSVALGVLVWRAFVRAGGVLRALSGVLVTALALVSLAAVMANVQGLVTPFGSLFPMLTDGAPDAELTAVLEQARQGLAGSAGAGLPPALQVMIGEFSLYHVAMAVTAPIVAVLLLGASAALWRRFAAAGSADRRARRVLGSYGVLTVALALAAIVLAVANAGVAADSAPALLALLEGGW